AEPLDQQTVRPDLGCGELVETGRVREDRGERTPVRMDQRDERARHGQARVLIGDATLDALPSGIVRRNAQRRGQHQADDPEAVHARPPERGDHPYDAAPLPATPWRSRETGGTGPLFVSGQRAPATA